MTGHTNTDVCLPARRIKAVAAIFITLATLLMTAGALVAGTTGNLSGTVVDRSGPVAGATVVLGGPNLPAGRTVTTGADGLYRFLALPPGTYTITVVFAGGAPVSRAGIQVTSDKSLNVPPISMTIEKVEVKAEANQAEQIQPGSTTLGQSLNAAKLEALPTGRSYESVVEILSGSAGDDGTGGQSIYGASGLESTYVIDGVNTTAVMTGKPGKALNFDFVEEIQVKTAGYEPEFGRALGGVVNVVTKSGTNEFHGGAELFWSGLNYVARPQEADNLTAYRVGKTAEFPMSVGGPIVKDKLWFFLAYSPNREETVARQFNAAGNGRDEATNMTRSNLFSGKITWQMTPSQRLVLTSFSDPAHSEIESERWGIGEDRKVDTGGVDTALKYTAILGADWILDGQAGVHNESNDMAPLPIGFPIGADRRASFPTVRKNPGGTNVGSAPPEDPSDPVERQAFENRYLSAGPYAYSGKDDAKRDFYRLSVEHLMDTHDLKFGYDLEQNGLDQTLDYGWGTGMSLDWTDLRASDATGKPIGAPSSVLGVRRCWGDGQGRCLPWNQQPTPSSKTISSSIYAQDRWGITPRLAFTYGLRSETQDLQDGGGHTVASLERTMSPRLGLTYDPKGEGKMKVYGSFGRFTDTVPLEITSRVFDPRITSIRLYRTSGQGYKSYEQFVGELFSIDPSFGRLCATDTPTDNAGILKGGFGCWDFERSPSDPVAHDPFGRVLTPFQTIDFGTLFPSPVDARLKPGTQDEMILGTEWAFTPTWALGVRAIHRDLNDVVEDLSLDYGRTYIIANPGGTYRVTPDPADHAWFSADARCVPGDPATYAFCGTGDRLGCAPGRECAINNRELVAAGFGAFPKPKREFRGLELNLRKNFSHRYELNATYLLSTTEGNYRGRYIEDIEERDPHPTEAFDFPILTYNADGYLPQDHRHQLKIFGGTQTPIGLRIGASYRWLSGSPLSATTDPDNFNNPFAYGRIFLMPQGYAGRTPSIQQLDLQISYPWAMSQHVRAEFFLDIFNVLNRQVGTRFEQQFLQAGSADAVTCGSVPGFCGYDDAVTFGGEPTKEFLDQIPGAGNHNGQADPAEWDAWVKSIQGRFRSVQSLYHYFKTTTFAYRNPYTGLDEQVSAFPGFTNCAAQLPDNPSSCKGIYDLYGLTLARQAPRSLRFGMKISF